MQELQEQHLVEELQLNSLLQQLLQVLGLLHLLQDLQRPLIGELYTRPPLVRLGRLHRQFQVWMDALGAHHDPFGPNVVNLLPGVRDRVVLAGRDEVGASGDMATSDAEEEEVA